MEIKAVIQQPLWSVKVLPRLVYPLDFYPLLIFHVDTCNAAGSNLECIKDGYTWEEGKGQVEQMMSARPWPGEREKSKWTECDRVLKLGCMAGPTDGPVASVSPITARTGGWVEVCLTKGVFANKLSNVVRMGLHEVCQEGFPQHGESWGHKRESAAECDKQHDREGSLTSQ